MTHYEFYKTMPMERISRLQAARIFPRNTMRNIVIYEQFLDSRHRAHNCTSKFMRVPTVMDAYMEVAEKNGLSEERIQQIVLLMERELPT